MFLVKRGADSAMDKISARAMIRRRNKRVQAQLENTRAYVRLQKKRSNLFFYEGV